MTHTLFFHEIFIICPDPGKKIDIINADCFKIIFDMLNKDDSRSRLFISTDWDNYADDISGSLKSKNHNFDSRLISAFLLGTIKISKASCY